MKPNPLDTYRGFHILVAESQGEPVHDPKSGSYRQAFTTFLPRAFISALCFRYDQWEANFLDNSMSPENITNTIEDCVHFFSEDPNFCCQIFLVTEDLLDEVEKKLRAMIAITQISVQSTFQNKSAVAVIKDYIQKYKGNPFEARYSGYEFNFLYFFVMDDEDERSLDPEMVIDTYYFRPTSNKVDESAFLIAQTYFELETSV